MRFHLLPPLGMAALALGLLMAADPAPVSPETQPITVEGVDWHARAEAWFVAPSTEPKARRKEMKQMTKALKRPCRYCHSKDFKSYPDERLKLVTQQMMVISKEHDVTCKGCHSGRGLFTHMGEESKGMWKLSAEKGVLCDHCHTPSTRFEKLTAAGEAFAKEQAKKKGHK